MDYKELFIKDVYSEADESTIIRYRANLRALNMYENRIDYPDNFFDFFDEQLKTTLLKLSEDNAKPTNDQLLSVSLKYIQWARLNDLSKVKSNSFELIFDEVKQILAKDYKEAGLSQFVSRDSIYSLENSEMSKRDLIVYTAIFEGIYGKGGQQLLDLKESDLYENSKKINIDGILRTVPSKFINQCKQASKCKGYQTGKGSFVPFQQSDYVLKSVPKQKNRENSRLISFVQTILRTKTKKYLKKSLDAEKILTSGMCYYLRLIELNNKKLKAKDYLQVLVRYSKGSQYNSLRNLKENYKSYKKFCSQNNIEISLDSELLTIINEISELDFEYPKNYKRLEVSQDDADFIRDTDKLLDGIKDSTEKEGIIKIRVGQGYFKKKLLNRSCKCEICGFDYQKLLIASHCKPWSKSDDTERLNPNNGLILCPAHDSLFDKGLIYFDNDGNIQLSSKLNREQFKLLNINGNEKLYLNSDQIEFIEWHKKNHNKLK